MAGPEQLSALNPVRLVICERGRVTPCGPYTRRFARELLPTGAERILIHQRDGHLAMLEAQRRTVSPR